MAVEDGEVIDRRPEDSPESADGDRKRNRSSSRGEEEGSSKRHKDHKHKKHKKHSRRDRDRDDSQDRHGSRSGSLSPPPKDSRDRHRSNSRTRQDRSRSRERNRRRSRSRGRDRSVGRDNRDRSSGRDARNRGRDDRGRGSSRDRARDNSRGREDRRRDNRERSRGRAERDREARGNAYKRELEDTSRNEPEREREQPAKAAPPSPPPAPPAPPSPVPDTAAEEEEEYRRRVEEQMKESGMDMDEDSSEDEEAAALEAARKRRQAILEKHAAAKKIEEEKKQTGAEQAAPSDHNALEKEDRPTTDQDSSDDEDMKAGDVDEMEMVDDRKREQQYDMFGADDEDVAAEGEGGKVEALERTANVLDVDNFDDADGYYKFQMGETMNGRYEVYEVTGKGVFSNVLRARDSGELVAGRERDNNGEVAIKVIRNNDMMKKCADKELLILQLLAKDNGADKHNIVQLNEHFFQHGHMCLVFEAMAMNLREVIKKFGHNRGINIGAVHKFAKQMFVALKHLKACKVVHADIKPDNILVNDKHNQIKVCDFGSASFIEECEITPYLVSRWYRGPEITLCLRYDYGIDMWSIATCLYELYTGKVMFPGSTNNDMLRRFQEVKGKFPNKLLKRSIAKQMEIGRPVDFTEDFKFLRVLTDKVTKKESIKIIAIGEKPEKDLLKLLMPRKLPNPDEEKMVKLLCDLLHGALMLNSEQRLTPEQALKHAFVKTQIQA